MRKFLQRILKKPMTRLADRLSSAPDENLVFKQLSKLYRAVEQGDKKAGLLLDFDPATDRLIIFSDQHKGAKDAADDFAKAEQNYRTALSFYHQTGYTLICAGDCEELWKFKPTEVCQAHAESLKAEFLFAEMNRYHRMIGNHDLEWKHSLLANAVFQQQTKKAVPLHDGLLLRWKHNDRDCRIFICHGHQGDAKSDGNLFSKWFVAAIWTPVQRYLEININSISSSFDLVDAHNRIMYEWSAKGKNLIFIAGHTHKPVFASLDHIERLTQQLKRAKDAGDQALVLQLKAELKKRKIEYAGKKQVRTQAKPCYFNTGCCCFVDGDITGIELADAHIRLVKWKTVNGQPQRQLLEEVSLEEIVDNL